MERYDNEYERRGSCALFMLFEPLRGQREVIVRSRRTALDYAAVVDYAPVVDYAAVVRHLCEEVHPEAEKIVLVQDNLNTHGPWSLYQAFAPEQARALVERIEWHSTPRHGPWLNRAEIELSVLARQCLSERMESQSSLAQQVAHWQQHRNAASGRVDWRFEIQEARCKLKRLYPKKLFGNIKITVNAACE